MRTCEATHDQDAPHRAPKRHENPRTHPGMEDGRRRSAAMAKEFTSVRTTPEAPARVRVENGWEQLSQPCTFTAEGNNECGACRAREGTNCNGSAWRVYTCPTSQSQDILERTRWYVNECQRKLRMTASFLYPFYAGSRNRRGTPPSRGRTWHRF